MDSSTEQYPTSLVVLPDIQHFKAAPCLTFIRKFSSGVLTMVHMVGAAYFPCPRPWVGVLGVLTSFILHRLSWSLQRMFLMSESYFI